MGTNFYARIIPTIEQKEELIEAINNNDFVSIKEMVADMYDDFTYHGAISGGNIHLGKRSGGWKFLWNPNMYITRELLKDKDGRYYAGKYLCQYLYPLTKQGIKDFISRDDIEIYDEYGEKHDKESFFQEAVNWTTWNGKEAWDSKTYHLSYPEERTYPCDNNIIRYMIHEGQDFISNDRSDFYSDGLRFATTTEFS
jgi:hypothetical protein